MFNSLFSFFGKGGSVFANLFNHAPTAAQTVNTVVKLVAPILSAIIAKTAGEQSAAAVDAIIKEIETDLAVASTTIQAMGLSGTGRTTVATSLQAVVNNLGGLLAAGHIKNPALVAEVNGDVQFAVKELNAVIDVISQYKTPPAA